MSSKNCRDRFIQFGPFQFDFRHLDLNQLSNQILSVIQPLVGRTGELISAIASSAAQFLGWALFVLLISYFVLAESGGLRGRIVWFDVPGYTEDIRRLGHELNRIWNAFLRGQFIVFFLTAIAYTIVLGYFRSPLCDRYSFAGRAGQVCSLCGCLYRLDDPRPGSLFSTRQLYLVSRLLLMPFWRLGWRF